ncbi:uncharacterized protein LOC144666222 [Oculina patagonica]
MVVVVSQASQALSFKAGKDNVTTTTPGLFACKKIFFQYPFYGRQQVKVFTSVSHTLTSPTPRSGAAIWVEDVTGKGFTVCVVEYGQGSNGTVEVNWIALKTGPPGSQLGTASLNPWTVGTKCKRIVFKQRFKIPPSIFVTASHQFPKRPQDAMAVWVETLHKDSFKICLRETKILDGTHKNIKINWLAFTDLRLENFTLTNSAMFNNTAALSHQDNYAFCQTINFTDPFFAPPVVVVTPKYSYKNNYSFSSQCNAVTAWIEHTSIKDMKVCVRNYNSKAKNKDTITVDYMVIGDLDPCLDVTCHYHGLCKAFGPHDARCVCVDSCPSYHEPVCSSNGTTYDNECLYKQEMCLQQLNFTVQHPGSCEGFPFQRGRRHMSHIPSLGYSHCEVIRFKPYVFYPDKPIEVQITVNHIDTSDRSYVHDAAVSWVENVNYDQFTACVMAAGFNERKSHANMTVDWMTYQGAPVGGVTGKVRMSQWWTGTTCTAVNFPSGRFKVKPSVFVTAEHHHSGLKRDAASVWIEDVTQSSCKVCLRELQNYAGSHQDISVNWLAFTYLHKPPFSEHNSIYFVNAEPPPEDQNNAFCKDVNFANFYNGTPYVFVSADHSSKGGNLSPVHNGITAWVEYINKTGFRVCLKELFEEKYDPLSITYTVLSEICQPGWGYFNGYCFFTSTVGASWLAAVSNCSAMGAHLVTVHNQEENVYIQHRHNGEKSWIGLNDRSVEESFVWTNREISSFRFWAPKQPNSGKNEDCVHTLGAQQGYGWDDVPCNRCYNFTCFKVIDECVTNYHSCDVNAICQNTVGSYNCTCKAGFYGNGRKCFDVDECKTKSHSCDVNAVCNNTKGGHNCTCKGGYTGDGKNCTDINECSTKSHSCDVNAVCHNTKGSYKCTCKAGYTGDGNKCSVRLTLTTRGRTGRFGTIQKVTVPRSALYHIKAWGARGGTHSYNYGYKPGTYYGGKGAYIEGKFRLTKGTVLNVVVGQRGGNSVEVQGGRRTTKTAAQLGLSVWYYAGTGGGGGSFVYTTSNVLLLAAGGGGGASGGYHGVDGQSGSSGTSSMGKVSSCVRAGGTGGQPGQCNSAGASYHGGVGAGWYAQGCARAGSSHGERGGSRAQGWTGGQAGRKNSGYNGGPAPGAVGGFGGGGGGAQAGGAAGGGGGYSGGGSGTREYQAGGGGGSYCSGQGCSGVTGGNSNDVGLVKIIELSA